MALNDAVPSSATDVFKRNAEDADRLLNGIGDVTTRIGKSLPTWDEITKSHAAWNNRGTWTTATAYAVNDIWESAGVWYVVLTPYTSGATAVADIAGPNIAVLNGNFGSAATKDAGTDFDQIPLNADIVYPVANVTELRALTGISVGQAFELKCHTNTGLGGGQLLCTKLHTAEVDDNGFLFVIDGFVIERQNTVLSLPEDFGALYSGDDSIAFKAALSHGGIVSTLGKEISVDAFTVGDFPDETEIHNSIINVTNERFKLTLTCHLESCVFKGAGFNLLGGKTLTFNNLHFQDIDTNGITMNGNNKVSGSNLSADNIGTNVGLSPPSEGHVIFGVNSLVDSECVVRGFRATNIFGQGAIGTTRCRNFKIYDSIIDSTAYRAFSHYGDVTDGLGALGHEIINTTISRCGELLTGTSGVGANGIYSQTASNATGGVLEDLVVRGAVIADVAENGFEGHGLFENILVKRTGAYPLLTTPSKEGAWIQSNSVLRNIQLINSNDSGLVFSTSADNILVDGLVIDGYGEHGIESNNSTANNYNKNNFVIKNVEIVQEPNDVGVHDAVFIGDTSSGVTSYGGSSRLENITSGGNKVYSPTESGGAKFVETRISPLLPILDEYSKLTTIDAFPTTGTHYLTDRIRNVLGITAGLDYEYVCVRSGTFESRSATNCTFSSGKRYFDSSTSTLEVGDVTEIPAGSDTVNDTVKRWTITHIQGDRHFVDRVIYGTSTTATIPTAAPTFETLVKS